MKYNALKERLKKDGETRECLFQNTELALNACAETLDDDGTILMRLDGDECRAAIKLIELCRGIAGQFEGVDLHSTWKERK